MSDTIQAKYDADHTTIQGKPATRVKTDLNYQGQFFPDVQVTLWDAHYPIQRGQSVTGDITRGKDYTSKKTGKTYASFSMKNVQMAGGASAPVGAPGPAPTQAPASPTGAWAGPPPLPQSVGPQAGPAGLTEGDFLASGSRVYAASLEDAVAITCGVAGVNHFGELSDKAQAELVKGAFAVRATYSIGIQRGDIRAEAPAPPAPAPQPQQQDAPPPPGDGDDPFGIPF